MVSLAQELVCQPVKRTAKAKLVDFGMRPPPDDEDLKREGVALLRKGWRPCDVAKRLGIKVGRIWKWKYGLLGKIPFRAPKRS